MEGRGGFGGVFGVGEFRALWLAQVLSIVGDQLARVALSLLVFARTGSTALTALTYALTFLPDLVGGPLLSGLADRLPRRNLMVAMDVARALLVAVMAVPGVSLLAVIVLLVIVQLAASPFNAARAALMPAMLEGDLYVTGQAVFTITYQTGQLVGYVVGGVLVALTGPHLALAVDAATFAASALLIGFGVRQRAAVIEAGGRASPVKGGTWRSLREGARLVWQHRDLRALVALACISGFYVIPEGLSVPYARELGGGAVTAGLLFAAMPAGVALGMAVLTRLVPQPTRLRMLGPQAVLACAVLVVCALRPGLVVTLLVWAVAGAAAGYQAVASAAFMRAVPDSGRGQAFGLASTSLRAAQGLGVVAAGALAGRLAPSLVVAIAGAAGTVVALLAAAAWHRARTAPPAAAVS
jgi:MFS family permease